MNLKRLLTVFLPLLLLALFTLFIRIVQYKPLFPDDIETEETAYQVPIFPEDPIIGDKKAPVTLIAFEDFGCAHCKEQYEILSSIEKEHPGTLKLIWKSLPITRFPYDTNLAAEYAFCANKQNKFNEFKQFAFSNYENLTEETLKTILKEIQIDEKKWTACIESTEAKEYLEKNKNLAKILGIQQLPTMFIGNKQISLPDTEAGWKNLLGI